MASGCPAIPSQTGGCPDVSGGAALLANPYDPADFAAKIMSGLNDKDLRQELRAKALQRAAWFNWERTTRHILDGLR
jgi:glycosyltransferase involved in cell wall biosynthesis